MLRATALALALFASPLMAQEDDAPDTMTLERLDAIVMALDPDAQTNGRVWQLRINGIELLIVIQPHDDLVCHAFATARDNVIV